MYTISEFAAISGVSTHYLASLCTRGHIPGAKKANAVWLIPEDAEIPNIGIKERIRLSSIVSIQRPSPLSCIRISRTHLTDSSSQKSAKNAGNTITIPNISLLPCVIISLPWTANITKFFAIRFPATVVIPVL